MSGSYSPEVASRFSHPRWAAAPDEQAPVQGRAGSRARGAEVELLVWPSDAAAPGGDTPVRQVAQARFRAFGCPHLLAAADLLCEQLEGQAESGLERVDPHALAEKFAVPVEKLGRLLLLEDAAHACWRQLQG